MNKSIGKIVLECLVPYQELTTLKLKRMREPSRRVVAVRFKGKIIGGIWVLYVLSVSVLLASGIVFTLDKPGVAWILLGLIMNHVIWKSIPEFSRVGVMTDSAIYGVLSLMYCTFFALLGAAGTYGLTTIGVLSRIGSENDVLESLTYLFILPLAFYSVLLLIYTGICFYTLRSNQSVLCSHKEERN